MTSTDSEAGLPRPEGTTPPRGGGRRILNGSLIALFLANLLNFFDRAIPGVVAEEIKQDYGLSDLELGLASAAFVIVYALAGIPLGRLADARHRPRIIAGGLTVWSLFTAATGVAQNFGSLLLARLAVGVGEATFAPAANAMIGDLYDARRRSRALGILMLGLPLGLMLAYFTVGAITEAAGTWRAAFFVAAVPGLLLAAWVFFLRDPERGQSEEVAVVDVKDTPPRPIRSVLAIRTVWWLIAAGVCANFSAYAVNTFTVPLLQRHYDLSLTSAAGATGLIVGVTGLICLTLGARVADRLAARSPAARLLLGVASAAVAAPLTWLALAQDGGSTTAFVLWFSLGWLLSYTFYLTAYPALHDVVVPRLRATATAVFFAAFYILGGFAGPIVVGAISDARTRAAYEAAGSGRLADYSGAGLSDALYTVPVMLALSALFLWLAARSVGPDAAAMRRRLSG